MVINNDYSFDELENSTWCGAEKTLQRIREEEKKEEFETLFEEIFFEREPSLTEVNDWLRFESDSIFEYLGIEEE